MDPWEAGCKPWCAMGLKEIHPPPDLVNRVHEELLRLLMSNLHSLAESCTDMCIQHVWRACLASVAGESEMLLACSGQSACSQQPLHQAISGSTVPSAPVCDWQAHALQKSVQDAALAQARAATARPRPSATAHCGLDSVNSASDSVSSRHSSLCSQEQKVVVPMLQQENLLQYATPQESPTGDQSNSTQLATRQDSLACSTFTVPHEVPPYPMPSPLNNSVKLPSQDLSATLAGAVTLGQDDRTPLQPDVDDPALSPQELPSLVQQEADLSAFVPTFTSQPMEHCDVQGRERCAATSSVAPPALGAEPGSAANERDSSPEPLFSNEQLPSEACGSEINGTSGKSVGVDIPANAHVGSDEQLQRQDDSPLAKSLREGSAEAPAPQQLMHAMSLTADVSLNSPKSPDTHHEQIVSMLPRGPESSQQPPVATEAAFSMKGDETASLHGQPAVDSKVVPQCQSSSLGHQHENVADLDEVRHASSLRAPPQTEALDLIDLHSQSSDGLREAAGLAPDAIILAENASTELGRVRHAAPTVRAAFSPTDGTIVEEELASLQQTMAALVEQLSNLEAEAGPVAAMGLAPVGKDPTHFHQVVPSLASSSERSKNRSTCSAACSQVEAAGVMSDFLDEKQAFEEWLNATVTAAEAMLDERDRLHMSKD